MEAGVLAQLAAISEIDALGVEIEAGGELHRAAFDIAGARQHVDQAAGRVRREGRGRAAADRLDRVHGQVVAEVDVGAHVEQVGKLQQRQAVFLDLHVFRSTGGERKPAHGIVVVAFADAGRDAQAGHGTQHLADRARSKQRDVIAAQRAGRGRAIEPVAALGHAGRKKFLRGFCGSAPRLLRSIGLCCLGRRAIGDRALGSRSGGGCRPCRRGQRAVRCNQQQCCLGHDVFPLLKPAPSRRHPLVRAAPLPRRFNGYAGMVNFVFTPKLRGFRSRH